ncbi:MAG: response regulator transcription factor [Betaproteobacteria bacterium]|nr:response regulator transcription factor [Betaproteobacteria bacterium]
MSPVRLVVIDDHTLFRRGITALLARVPDFEVVGEAADGFEGIKAVAAGRPDVVLLDLHMPGLTGIEAMQAILRENPGTHVVMLTVSERRRT